MKRMAVIPARGGSKRIPGKNLREFCGRPIMSYSIEAALESGIFDEVMVSTDSPEIAKIGEAYGAKIPFMRSAEAAGDHATIDDVLREVIEQYRKRGMAFEQLVCIYPTAPFVTADKLRKAVRLLTEHDVDDVLPVVAYSFPPQRSMVTDENGFLRYRFPEQACKRSQDLEAVYHDCGQFYAAKADTLWKELDDIRTLPMVVSELEVQDIDTETDWKLAELKFRLMNELTGV